MPTADVFVAWLHEPLCGHNFTQSLLEAVIFDFGHDQRFGTYVAMSAEANNLTEARNSVTRQFLDSDQEWLWWVDSDMGFKPSALYELLSVADPESAPVVGGLCFAWKKVRPDGLNGFHCVPRPTIYDYVEIDGGRKFAGRATYEPGAVTQCAATGSAMIVVHRSVFQQIRDEFGDVWYDRIQTPDGKVGEDISFCARVGAIGKPVHVHTGVVTNHMKTTWVGEADFAANPQADDSVVAS